MPTSAISASILPGYCSTDRKELCYSDLSLQSILIQNIILELHDTIHFEQGHTSKFREEWYVAKRKENRLNSSFMSIMMSYNAKVDGDPK